MIKANNLIVSISSRRNCHDNACAESFFGLLKRERIRREIYRSREEGKANILNYIELLYNPTRVMEIIITCRQWNIKRTIFETTQLSRKFGAIHKDT